jgi:small subunit ribosomal protein S16
MEISFLGPPVPVGLKRDRYVYPPGAGPGFAGGICGYGHRLWRRPGLGITRRNAMSARIRLKRFGTKKRPYYRIVVMDQRAPRDGKTIEELGYYHPIETEDRQISLEEDKVRAWLKNGASVSDTVRRILNKKSISLS